MSKDDLTMPAQPAYTFTIDKWLCEKHGEITSTVRFFDKDGVKSRDFCGECIGEPTSCLKWRKSHEP